MPKEIERKYLLKNEEWRFKVDKTYIIRQGYLSTAINQTVRVRVKNDHAFLMIKGETVGITRMEFEYEIPVDQANLMLDNLCIKPIIEKNRYIVHENGYEFEIDEFFGDNEGLLVAELELNDTNPPQNLPNWIGNEVSNDERYYNSSLLKHPYNSW